MYYKSVNMEQLSSRDGLPMAQNQRRRINGNVTIWQQMPGQASVRSPTGRKQYPNPRTDRMRSGFDGSLSTFCRSRRM
jgi:hypothetical protein